MCEDDGLPVNGIFAPTAARAGKTLVSGLTIRTSQDLQGEFWFFLCVRISVHEEWPVCVTINGIVERACCWLGTLMKDACEDSHTFVGPRVLPRQIFRYFLTRSNRCLINALQTRRIDPFVLAFEPYCRLPASGGGRPSTGRTTWRTHVACVIRFLPHPTVTPAA